MLIALMGVEEHKHALIAEVALSKTFLVQAVDLRVSQNVANTLKIYNHHVALGELPRKVAQALSDHTLGSIFSSVISPSGIVVVLFVFAFDEVFTVVVLEWSTGVENLVDERMHELDHVARVNYRNHLIIELVHDVLADEHGLDVVFHILGIVGNRVNILRDLDNILFIEIFVNHHEGVAHSTLSEWILSDVDQGADLTLLQQRLLPVDVNTDILSNEP